MYAAPLDLIEKRKSILAGEPINNVLVTFLLGQGAAPLIENRKSILVGEPINNVLVTFLLNK